MIFIGSNVDVILLLLVSSIKGNAVFHVLASTAYRKLSEL